MRRYLFGLTFLGLLLLGGCKGSEIPDPPINVGSAVYSPDIQEIMMNNCISCHGGPAPSAGLLLDNYDGVREAAEFGNLVSRINDAANPMPPVGRLNQQNRDRIVKWVQDGFPRD